MLNITEEYGVFVRVRAGIDVVTRIITWDFQALDPLTGEVGKERGREMFDRSVLLLYV